MLVKGQRRGLEDWLAVDHVPIRNPTRLGVSAQLRAHTPVWPSIRSWGTARPSQVAVRRAVT